MVPVPVPDPDIHKNNDHAYWNGQDEGVIETEGFPRVTWSYGGHYLPPHANEVYI